MDYKDTINLPRTAFAMKANLANREPGMIEAWEQAGLYRQIVPMKKQIADLKAGKEKAEQELALLQFQVDEIESADIRPGEDEELIQKRDQLQNAAQIFETVNNE